MILGCLCWGGWVEGSVCLSSGYFTDLAVLFLLGTAKGCIFRSCLSYLLQNLQLFGMREERGEVAQPLAVSERFWMSDSVLTRLSIHLLLIVPPLHHFERYQHRQFLSPCKLWGGNPSCFLAYSVSLGSGFPGSANSVTVTLLSCSLCS